MVIYNLRDRRWSEALPADRLRVDIIWPSWTVKKIVLTEYSLIATASGNHFNELMLEVPRNPGQINIPNDLEAACQWRKAGAMHTQQLTTIMLAGSKTTWLMPSSSRWWYGELVENGSWNSKIFLQHCQQQSNDHYHFHPLLTVGLGSSKADAQYSAKYCTVTIVNSFSWRGSCGASWVHHYSDSWLGIAELVVYHSPLGVHCAWNWGPDFWGWRVSCFWRTSKDEGQLGPQHATNMSKP